MPGSACTGARAAAPRTLQGHALDDLLAANGLIGPQRAAKMVSIDHAVEERRRKRGWKPLKALLGYLDSVLGSLVKALPWLEPVKEFKEDHREERRTGERARTRVRALRHRLADFAAAFRASCEFLAGVGEGPD